MTVPIPTAWRNWSTTPSSDAIGPMIDGWALKQGLVNTLQLWLPTYVAEFNRQVGQSVMEVPYDYIHRPDERIPAKAPASAINTTILGTATTPERHGDGSMLAAYHCKVFAYYYGTSDWNESEALLYAFAALVRQTIVQNPSLGGVANTTKWTGIKFYQDKTLTSPLLQALFADIDFVIVLSDVGNALGGVPTPTLDPLSPLPTVTDVGVTVEAESL